MTAEVEMAVSNSQLASVPSAVPMADAAVAVELLRMIEDELGCDPHTVVGHEAAAALRSVHAGDRIAAGLLVDVFDRTATSLEMPDLAVRFAEWATISRLGYVAQLWSHMPTLGELLDAATRYLPLENGALLANIDRDGTEVWFSYHLRQRFGGRETMFMETNIAVAVRTIRACFGEDWNPIRVTFRHHPRTSLARLSGYYGAPVAVGTSSDAICFTTADMSRRGVDAGDDTSGDIILQFLQERVNRPAPDLLSQVSRLLARHLDTGSDVSVAATAAALAMSPRTLQRRLREAGTDFGAILSDVRADLVEHYLTDLPDLPVADLAERLGYADATAVSRFVRARFGCDTRALRTRLARQGTDRPVGLVARFDK